MSRTTIIYSIYDHMECRVFSNRDDLRRNDKCRAIIRESVVHNCSGLRRRNAHRTKKVGLIKTIKFLCCVDEETRQP